MYGALASGLCTSMSTHITTYYEKLNNKQIAVITATPFGSPIVAVLLVPGAGRRLGKSTSPSRQEILGRAPA